MESCLHWFMWKFEHSKRAWHMNEEVCICSTCARVGVKRLFFVAFLDSELVATGDVLGTVGYCLLWQSCLLDCSHVYTKFKSARGKMPWSIKTKDDKDLYSEEKFLWPIVWSHGLVQWSQVCDDNLWVGSLCLWFQILFLWFNSLVLLCLVSWFLRFCSLCVHDSVVQNPGLPVTL